MEMASKGELEEYKLRLDIALRAANICIFEVDVFRQTYTYFANAQAIFGVSDEQILKEISPYSKLAPEDYREAVSAYFSHPGDQKAIDEAFEKIHSGRPASYEARMRAGNSSFRWCRIDATPVRREDGSVRMIGVITDIDQLKREALSLENAAMFDSFTGLYHKKKFIELAQKALTEHREQEHTLILLDIDNFKHTNDSLGHQMGDRLLLQMAGRLKEVFGDCGIIGRFGGDEFVAFLPSPPDRDRLTGKLEAVLQCGGAGEAACTSSVGVALFPQDAADFHQLMDLADSALYQAKLKKHTYSFYGGEDRGK